MYAVILDFFNQNGEKQFVYDAFLFDKKKDALEKFNLIDIHEAGNALFSKNPEHFEGCRIEANVCKIKMKSLDGVERFSDIKFGHSIAHK